MLYREIIPPIQFAHNVYYVKYQKHLEPSRRVAINVCMTECVYNNRLKAFTRSLGVIESADCHSTLLSFVVDF